MRLTAALIAGPLDASAIVAASVRGLALTTIDGASFVALTALRRLDAGGNPLGEADGGAAVAELGALPALAELLLARCALLHDCVARFIARRGHEVVACHALF